MFYIFLWNLEMDLFFLNSKYKICECKFLPDQSMPLKVVTLAGIHYFEQLLSTIIFDFKIPIIGKREDNIFILIAIVLIISKFSKNSNKKKIQPLSITNFEEKFQYFQTGKHKIDMKQFIKGQSHVILTKCDFK